MSYHYILDKIFDAETKAVKISKYEINSLKW